MPGGSEWIFIFIIVLLLFGAKKLPELARGLGASIGEFKRARQAIEDEIRKAEQDLPNKSRETPKGIQPHHSSVIETAENSNADKGAGA